MAVKPEDIHIQNGMATWSINLSAKIGGTYLGTFVFRCVLTPMQTIQADRDRRELLGSNPSLADVHVDNLAYSLSQLKQRVIQAPPFWNDGSAFPGGSIADHEVIEEVLTASLEAQIKYQSQLKEQHTKTIEALKKTLEQRYKQEEEEQEQQKALEQTQKELEELDLMLDPELQAPPKKKRKAK